MANFVSVFALLACVAVLVSAQGINLYSLDSALTEAENQKASVSQSIADAIGVMYNENLKKTKDAVLSQIDPMVASTLVPNYKRHADIALLAADMLRTTNIDAPAFITSIQVSLSSRVASQMAYRNAVSGNLQGVLTSNSAAVANAFSVATAVRNQFRTEIGNNRIVVQNAANVNITASYTAENSRAVVEATMQNAQIAAASTALSTSVSASVASEASRADKACMSRAAAGSSSGAIAQQTGSNDYGSCLSTQQGVMYYSSAAKRVFICTGARWSAMSMFPPAFRDSTILSRAQAAVLTRMLNFGSVWTKCWRGSEQTSFGTSSAAGTFHSLCNNRGPTVTIAKTSSGRIFGGYTDQPWMSRGGWVTSWEAFLYRFNPSVPTIFERASLYYGGGYSNSMYDVSSYCTTFGGGHDWYLGSDCKTGYTSNGNSYYFASGQQPYDQNWFAGSYSSWALAEHEVYYLSA